MHSHRLCNYIPRKSRDCRAGPKNSMAAEPSKAESKIVCCLVASCDATMCLASSIYLALVARARRVCFLLETESKLVYWTCRPTDRPATITSQNNKPANYSVSKLYWYWYQYQLCVYIYLYTCIIGLVFSSFIIVFIWDSGSHNNDTNSDNNDNNTTTSVMMMMIVIVMIMVMVIIIIIIITITSSLSLLWTSWRPRIASEQANITWLTLVLKQPDKTPLTGVLLLLLLSRSVGWLVCLFVFFWLALVGYWFCWLVCWFGAGLTCINQTRHNSSVNTTTKSLLYHISMAWLLAAKAPPTTQ